LRHLANHSHLQLEGLQRQNSVFVSLTAMEAESSTADINVALISPIAPRYIKETSRGVKRHLEFQHYRSEVTRKKMVR